MRKLFITAFLIITALGFSQKKELGKVTIDELKEKQCPTDTSAAAAVLFSVGKSYFDFSQTSGFELVTEKYAKIKIYKKEGYDNANQSINYYMGGDNEKVSVSKAATYNLENNKIEKTKLTSEGEFVEKINKYWSRKKITLPNVKEGSIIEFKFEVRSKYIDIPTWQFQTNIPVVYSEFSTSIPEYFIYNLQYKGYLIPKVIKETLSRKQTISSKERENYGFSTRTNFSADEFTYQEMNAKYVLENIPALKEENYVNNINNYTSAILHELSAKRFPNQPYENFTTDWESVVKKVYKTDTFGGELQKTSYFEKDIDAAVSGLISRDEKIAKVLDFVKTRMNWDESYGIYCDAGVKKAYEERKGNAAEINLMLTAMLRYIGIDANPILVSTRSHGVSLFPSTSAYNYVITGIELQDQVLLLDATSKYSLPDILPVRDLNWFGRIIRKNESSAEIDLMPKSNSKDVISIMASINADGEVSGKIRDQYFDYNALVFRESYTKLAKDSYIEKVEKRHSGLEIGEYEVQNSLDLTKPIVENYDFKATNSIEIIGDKMYLSPFLFFALTENPFKQETREYPVDFVYPHQDKYNVTLTIPDGYVIETLPESKAIGMAQNFGNFKYMITGNGNKVQLVYTQDINQAIIGSEHYDMLKNFFKEIVMKQTEKVVLKKI